jgi:GNAT superfamily N-acetyltransferase
MEIAKMSPARDCVAAEAVAIDGIINRAATAYEGVIPDDCYHQPYMTMEELDREMQRMKLVGWEEDGRLVGVMGLEPVADVTLIRHAYVLPEYQRRGIGARLLEQLKAETASRRLLVGTWRDAVWAVDFYRKHGFHEVPNTVRLLETYWEIPRRQIETSVVLTLEIPVAQRDK